ncbi:Neutral/alkaline nonlysosomal ceramidase [Mycena rebaudengoi]|nr:Neutral/alkaline nonlysosomal ceramidase [Mycena rebaudengoi]
MDGFTSIRQWSTGTDDISSNVAEGLYLVGLEIADITGPVVEMSMIGYASTAQTDKGLHMRQHNLLATLGMGYTGVSRAVLGSLNDTYKELYHAGNVAFVGTHQHSGHPWLHPQSFAAILNGSLLAVYRAHASLAPGHLSLGNTTLNSLASSSLNSSFTPPSAASLADSRSRSPTAYLANPASDRAQYVDTGGDKADMDRGMSMLRFGAVLSDDSVKRINRRRSRCDGRGFLGFFAVHRTSIYENNTLISGDNKGMAAYLYESSVKPYAMLGNQAYVAGFVQGDYDGQPCPANSSTCGGRAQQCHQRGPGFASDAEYGYAPGYRVLHARNGDVKGDGMARVKGSVRSVHAYADMSKYEFTLGNGTRMRTIYHTCFSFAGRTMDGPGAFDLVVKHFITPAPLPEQIACQYPKPILLNTVRVLISYASVLRCFLMSILNIRELTTMAGRRIQETVRAKLISSKIIGEDAYVVVARPANTYAHYITTCEEYGVQRYEGACTLMGLTLETYVDKYTSLVLFFGDTPSYYPAFDAAPLGKHFGQIVKDVNTTVPYRVGDTVAVRFIGADPKNNLRPEGTFLSVDQLVSNKWQSVRSDSHASTIYCWTRESIVLGTSMVDISWTIEPGTSDSKPLIGSISSFIGTSSNSLCCQSFLPLY